MEDADTLCLNEGEGGCRCHRDPVGSVWSHPIAAGKSSRMQASS
jgi:hypothetical protein